MDKFTILVDMDDTIENLTDAWLSWLNMEYGTSVTRDDITEWNFAAAFPMLTEEQAYAPLLIDEFWDTVEPIPWAFECLCRLRAEGHEIYIVTASSCRSIPAKMERVLFRYFPFIDWDHVIVTSNKKMVRGDVLVDDAPHNLEGFDGIRILMDAPHNRSCRAALKNMLRVHGWQEVYDIILQHAGWKEE